MPYKGYSNYETWTVSWWLNNDHGLFYDLKELVLDCDGDSRKLASEIKEKIQEYIGEKIGFEPVADLLNSALKNVNYQEIAEKVNQELSYLLHDEDCDPKP